MEGVVGLRAGAGTHDRLSVTTEYDSRVYSTTCYRVE